MKTVRHRIVCLANSRRQSGRCIAGRVWDGNRPGNWIRPVSDREGEEVSEDERRYEDGRDPQVLDIIDLPLLSPKPNDHQQENWLLDSNFYWTKVGVLPLDKLQQLVDPVAPLWIDGHSTYSGRNDQIPRVLTKSLESSLRLIHVDSLQLSVFRPGEEFGNPKRRVQGRFSYARNEYALWITDPSYERKYLSKPDGEYEIGESFLTISLGEPFKEACYKLVATVIQVS